VQSGVPWCTPGGAYPSSSDWLRSSNKSCPASESVVHTRIHVNTHVYTSRYQDAWELTRIYIHCIYMYIYTYAHLDIRMHAHIRVYTCTFTRIHTQISGCMRTYAYIHVQVHVCTPGYQDAWAQIHRWTDHTWSLTKGRHKETICTHVLGDVFVCLCVRVFASVCVCAYFLLMSFVCVCVAGVGGRVNVQESRWIWAIDHVHEFRI